jgi:hypothetical protein
VTTAYRDDSSVLKEEVYVQDAPWAVHSLQRAPLDAMCVTLASTPPTRAWGTASHASKASMGSCRSRLPARHVQLGSILRYKRQLHAVIVRLGIMETKRCFQLALTAYLAIYRQ